MADADFQEYLGYVLMRLGGYNRAKGACHERRQAPFFKIQA